MKVMNHRDGEMELALSRQIRRIDPHYAYFIPLNGESCSIDSHSEELKRCIKQLRSSKSRSRSVTPLEITNLQGYFIVYGGQTLKEYVKQQHVNATTAWKWISHMITGLHKLYKAGFIHADIKYNNIVVSEKVLKLIDFGLGFSYKKEPEKVGDFLCDAKIYPAFYRAQTTRKSLNDLYAAHNVFYTMYQLKQHSPIKDPLGTYFMEAKQDPEKYRRFVWSHLEKVDLYSFFLTFFHSIWSETFFSSSIGKACWEIMYHNLHPDVEQCWTLEENLKYIESIPN
jgi:serine/threonine protein kinase